MSSYIHDARQISFETDRPMIRAVVRSVRVASRPDVRRIVARAVEVHTDWVLLSRCPDGVLIDASGVRKLDSGECLELAAWLTEAAKKIPARQPPRGRGRPLGAKNSKMRPPEPCLSPPDSEPAA